MDSAAARLLGEKVLDLLEMCAHYEGKYRHADLTLQSPEEAWQLSGKIFDKQREIARLLEPDTLNMESTLSGGWRLFHQRMDANGATELMKVVRNIMRTCAHAEQSQNPEHDNRMIKQYQHLIALMLDPKAVREQ